VQTTDYHDLVSRCLKKDTTAEYEFYRCFAAKMYGVCLRYGNNETDAAEILQLGFIRVFKNLHQFRFEGSIEGWIRRVIVSTAINYCHKSQKAVQNVEINFAATVATKHEDSLSILSTKELLAMIRSLPPGYRTIFNLYEIEGYSHDEIAGMLGISSGTSKSQLFRAKEFLTTLIHQSEK